MGAMLKLRKRLAVLFGVTIGAFVGFGAAPSFASTTYDFTFSGSSGGTTYTITSGTITVSGGSGTEITAISGSVAGFTASGYTGALSLVSASPSNTFTYTNSTTYSMNNTITLEVGGNSADTVTLKLAAGSGSSQLGGKNSCGTGCTYPKNVAGTAANVVPTPGPVPGTGALSFVALAFAGLLFGARRLVTLWQRPGLAFFDLSKLMQAIWLRSSAA